MLKNKLSIYVISALLVAGAGIFLISNNLATSAQFSSEIETTSSHPSPSNESPHKTQDSSQFVDSVAAAAQRLRDKLEKSPNNIKGWILLGRAYQHLEQWDEADFAFAKAKEFGYSGPIPQPGATAAANPYASSPHMSKSPHASNPHMSLLADNISSATTATNSNNSPEKPESKAGSAGIKNKPFQSGVPVNVSISSNIADKLSTQDSVFIFARATNGSKAPLAVVKKQVKDLPLTITLNDSMSMMPSHSLSSADEIIVGARISKSGNAIRSPGDFETFTTSIKEKPEQPLTLEVKKQVE